MQERRGLFWCIVLDDFLIDVDCHLFISTKVLMRQIEKLKEQSKPIPRETISTSNKLRSSHISQSGFQLSIRARYSLIWIPKWLLLVRTNFAPLFALHPTFTQVSKSTICLMFNIDNSTAAGSFLRPFSIKRSSRTTDTLNSCTFRHAACTSL